MSISTLPCEIIADVLSRLPVKSLMRLRSVCKSWRSLISDTKFIKLHLNRAIQDVNVSYHRVFLSSFQSIDYELSRDDVFIAFDSLTRVADCSLEIAESCHGLLCIVFDYDNIIICNPSTRDFRELPKPTTFLGVPSAYGLGYDASVDDYKLVRVARSVNSSNSGNIQVEVFSLRSTSWRRIQDIHPGVTLIGRGTFSNGALHWLVNRETSQMIVSFDLATEDFVEVVSLPEQSDKNIPICGLTVLGGCLSITSSEYCYLYREVWVMKEYGKKASWSKLFTISCDETAPQFEDWMEPISLLKNGEALLDVDGRELVVYNPKEMTFRSLAIKDEWDWFETAVYVETLVSPNGNNGGHT